MKMNRDLVMFLIVFAFVETVLGAAVSVLWWHAGMVAAMLPSALWVMVGWAAAWVVRDDRRNRLRSGRNGRKN